MQAVLPHISQALWRHGALVLCAEPGAGKTTLVPWALAQHPAARPGQIWVLEPRRLAARMAAAFVARGLGEAVGQRVGHRMRDDDVTGPRTRLVYMTQGLLGRLMLRQPRLPQVACIIFDEFHERTLGTDVTLGALAHRRRIGLPGPALLVMSATLAAEPVADLLQQAPIVKVAGRRFPVAITHVPHRSQDPLEVQVARAVGQVAAVVPPEGARLGHVLTFLPGARGIDRAARACAQVAARCKLAIAPLHGGLPAAAQDAAVAQGGGRRLILATNVAETSLTIEGVTHVIDAGLANIARDAPLTGVRSLITEPISQAAAIQRAGRAGRTGPGSCLRLYTLADYRQRPPFEMPEILRLDVAEAILWLSALGLPDLQALPLLDRPAPSATALALATLARLGAWHQAGITPLGRTLLALPLHPRLGAVALAAQGLGIAALGADAEGMEGSDFSAGACADGGTAAAIRSAGLDPRALLAGNDSHSAFASVGALFDTGPTGTNVNDFRAILVR